MRQVVGRYGSAVNWQPEIVAHRIGDDVVERAGAVVNPVHQRQRVHAVQVNRICAVIPNPDAVARRLQELDVARLPVHAETGQFALAGSEVAVDNHNPDFFLRRLHDLRQNGLVAPPGNYDGLHLFPFRHCPDGQRWRLGDAEGGSAGHGFVF